ncbi:MAG: HAMP domain-containing protein [Desulfuromonadales bacterium]|nr:HAMP domain-containing protein [Desulfuromonadales bacterium]
MVKSVGLRAEILLSLTILLGAALLLGGTMMLHLMEKNLLRERIVQLDSLSQVLAQSLSPQIEANQKNIPQQQVELLISLPAHVGCINWWLYDQGLQLISSDSDGHSGQFSASRRQLAKLSGELQQKVEFPRLLNPLDKSIPAAFFIVPIKVGKRLVGFLELHFSLADIRHNLLRSQQLIVVYVFLYGIVLVLAGYYLLQRNIIKPARNLLLATEAVSRGDLETRLPIAGPTEIAQLAVAYNQMVEALHESKGETALQILSLENTNKALQETRNELIRSEKMASVGHLAAGLAHEVGNPLAALIGYLELLRQQVETRSEQDIVARSLVETNRIDFLVRELLDFARPADGNITEDINLVDELRASVSLLGNQKALGNIEVIDQLPDANIAVSFNRQKLQQVFINLLLNAVHACEPKGKIVLSAGYDENGCHWVEIQDSGNGIAPDHLCHIFEPFYTTKAPGQGTGLGLAISQRLVEEAGGRIGVVSQVGEGSVFRLEFDR